MAVTQNSYIGNGSTTNYSFTFPYLKTGDVKAQIDATVTTAFTLANATTVQFNTAPADGAKIKIYRETDDAALNATFYAGSALKSEDLNDNFTQNLYTTQEVNARYLSNLGGTMVGDMTMAEDVDIVFEGATDDAYETTLTTQDPTADRVITLPNVTGTVVTTGDTGTVTSTMIADATIGTADIAANAVTTAKVTDGNITTPKIAADAIDGTKIADDSINSEHYVDESIDTQHIADSQVTTDKLAANAVTTAKITDDSVTNAKIAAASVGTSELITNAVTTVKITNDAVTQDKIANDSIGNDQMKNNAIGTVELVDSSVTNAKMADGAVGTSELVNDAVVTDKIADNAVTTAKFADNVITNAKLADNAVNTAEIADSAITSAKISGGAIDTTKLSGATIVTAAEQSAATVNDTSFLTSSASDGRYFRQNSSETILDGATWTSSDAYIASTAAIDDRIVDLVDDVGGFVPIANETSFPNANPDVNNGTGTLVSIKALASNLTSNGSGEATISNGTVGNSTVTITGLDNSTTYNAGFGMIVETTSTLNTYTFHRQVPKATEVTTVAGSISNVNTVAGSISNVNSVASNNSNVTTTAGSISNVNTVAGSINNVNTAATNISSINDFADKYRIASSAPSSNNDEGDLYYNTSNDTLYIYEGSAWVQAVTSTSGLTTDAELAAWNGSTNVTTLGTIGTGTWQGTAIASGYIAADAVTGAKIADDSINSEHYVDGSIDTAHIADNQITNAKMADDAIGTAELSASGTASSSTFLRGDNTWGVPTDTNTQLSNAEVRTAVEAASDSNVFTDADHTKLNGIAASANNYSHPNHSGDVTSSGDGATTIANDAVTGAKIADNAIDSEHYTDGSIDTAHIADDAVTADKLANSINTEITANTAKTTNATHTGEVTGSGALTIADDVVDEANLKVSNAPTNGYYLQAQSGNTGGLTWAEVAAGGVSSDAQGNTTAGTNAGDAFSGTDAEKNTLIGYDAGTDITTADNTVAIGYQAGANITTGAFNCAVGTQALESVTTNFQNLAFGAYAAQYATGSSNAAFGYKAYKGVSGSTTGGNNCSFGEKNLENATSASDITSIGYRAGRAITTGSDNTCIGSAAGDALTTGSNNLILGHDAAASAVGVDNEITLGDTAITKFRVPGLNFSIKDSTATDNYVLTVDSNGDAGWEAAAGGGSDLTVQDEGSALSSAATTLNFVGAGVTSTGTGATKTITIPGDNTSPSGSNTQLQYNSSGNFAGSANLTFDGTNLTCAGTVSAVSPAVATAGLRKIHSGTSVPSSGTGAVGDLYIKY